MHVTSLFTFQFNSGECVMDIIVIFSLILSSFFCILVCDFTFRTICGVKLCSRVRVLTLALEFAFSRYNLRPCVTTYVCQLFFTTSPSINTFWINFKPDKPFSKTRVKHTWSISSYFSIKNQIHLDLITLNIFTKWMKKK